MLLHLIEEALTTKARRFLLFWVVCDPLLRFVSFGIVYVGFFFCAKLVWRIELDKLVSITIALNYKYDSSFEGVLALASFKGTCYISIELFTNHICNFKVPLICLDMLLSYFSLGMMMAVVVFVVCDFTFNEELLCIGYLYIW